MDARLIRKLVLLCLFPPLPSIFPPFHLHNRIIYIWKLTFLVLISRLLEPVGLWRSQAARCSRGRRWKKSERRKARLATSRCAERSIPRPQVGLSSQPVISSYMTLGANSTTRTLGSLGHGYTPGTARQTIQGKVSSPNPLWSNTASTPEWLAAVFVCRSTQPIPLHAHLPALVAMASNAEPQNPAIRLVSPPQTAATRLSKSLHLPRVGIVGIAENCPQAAALIAHVRQHVPPPSRSK